MTPHVGAALSYHVQISAPADVEIIEAGLRNAAPYSLVERLAAEAPATERAVDPRFEPIVRGPTNAVHLYVPRAHEHRAGIVWVRLRASRSGFLTVAPCLALMVAVLLGGFAIRANQIIGSTETGAAILLLGPALIAGFLVRPGEHAMVRHLLRGARAFTAVLAVLPFLAAAILVTFPGESRGPVLFRIFADDAAAAPDALRIGWAVVAGVAAVLMVGLLLSRTLPRSTPRRQRRPSHAAPFHDPDAGTASTTDDVGSSV
jgi:hypothetical protein